MGTEDKAGQDNKKHKAITQNKPVSESEQVKISSEEINLNRQINYTIIRSLWFVAKGEVKSIDDKRNLYKYLDMSKTRYDRICGGESAVVSQKLLNRVEKEMGIDKRVFSGEIRLSLEVNSGKANNAFEPLLVNYAIDKKALRIAREENNKAVGKDKLKRSEVDKERAARVRSVQDRIKKRVKYYVVDNNAIDYFNDTNMRKLALFVRDGEVYSFDSPEQVTRVIKLMESIAFNDLDVVKSELLGKYLSVLKGQLSNTNAILVYRQAKKKKTK